MNAIVAEKESSEVVDFRAPGPGERLRNARMARDMDVSKIAEKLHLTADMVDALERDDYSELPARVFVRGYLRNYARLVDLPADSVMSQFDEIWPEDDAPVKIDRAPRLPADSRPGSRWSGAITWLLLLAVLGLFLVWWQGHLDQFTQTDNSVDVSSDSLPSGPVTDQAPTLSLPRLQDGTDEPVSGSSASEGGSGVLRLPPVPSASVDLAPSMERPGQLGSGSAPAVTAEPKIESLEGIVAALEQSEMTEEQVLAEAKQTSPAEAAAVEVATEQGVLVRFTDDCWVDIRGANRSFKLFGTMRKGTEKRLEGTPPYKFVVGKASAVEVYVDGERFDLAPHTRDNVARFSISL
ncbi:MAG: DUF4115 domain-containing protein [Gammaproteobacteria bacterium]|nr:DUF4115 domain-containing protein [Gammaproteobacteria bacterium]